MEHVYWDKFSATVTELIETFKQGKEKLKKKKVGGVRYDWIKVWAKQGPPQSLCMTHGTGPVTIINQNSQNQIIYITHIYVYTYLEEHYGAIIG